MKQLATGDTKEGIEQMLDELYERERTITLPSGRRTCAACYGLSINLECPLGDDDCWLFSEEARQQRRGRSVMEVTE